MQTRSIERGVITWEIEANDVAVGAVVPLELGVDVGNATAGLWRRGRAALGWSLRLAAGHELRLI